MKFCGGEFCRVSAGQTAEIEHDAVHGLRFGVVRHVSVAVEVNPGAEVLFRQQLAGLPDGILLHIKGQHTAVFACQTAQQRCVSALPAVASIQKIAFPNLPPEHIMHNRKCVHALPSSKAAAAERARDFVPRSHERRTQPATRWSVMRLTGADSEIA